MAKIGNEQSEENRSSNKALQILFPSLLAELNQKTYSYQLHVYWIFKSKTEAMKIQNNDNTEDNYF